MMKFALIILTIAVAVILGLNIDGLNFLEAAVLGAWVGYIGSSVTYGDNND